MTQEELWKRKYNEVKGFVEKNRRNPSKHREEDRLLLNWIKHNRKMMNAGKMNPARRDRFMKLLELLEKYKRVNQYA